ncbi:MAG: CheR family methyltransferase [Bacteroidales bacterium]
MGYEIGIVETRNIIKALLETYGYDFRDYALTSFKRRLEDIITKNGLKDSEVLISRLQSNKSFFEQFLKDITPETTEMFRDPSLWRALYDDIIPIISKSTSKPKIWVASFDSGEELFSLCILLKEMNLLEHFSIFVSVFSDETIKKIQEGKIDARQLEVNEANYDRTKCEGKYSNYYSYDDNGFIILDKDLIKDVKFIKQDTLYNNAPSSIKLALFRNQIIYFNTILQDKAIKSVHESLSPGGFMVLGAKETLENTNCSDKFTVVNDGEKIYKKKTG